MKRVLEIIRDGHRRTEVLQRPLAEGEQGNVQALAAMKKIVLEDRTQPDLRTFVLKYVVQNYKSHDTDGLIKALFDFAQKGIAYVEDPVGVERIADAWSVVCALNPNQPEGDCGIKSLFLASTLALVGVKTCFVVLRDNPNYNNYNHVYVGLLNDFGGYIALDPTLSDSPIGTEAPANNRAIYSIFD